MVHLKVTSMILVETLAVFAAGSLICASAAGAPRTLTVPQGNHAVMIDGKMDPGEWDDAAEFPLGDVARIYVKQSGDYVWMAVELIKGSYFALDFYLQPADGVRYDLHSSAKLGERRQQGRAWPADWTWWNNDGWVANWSRVQSFEQRTFLPQRVREYQISRRRFAGKAWRVMFELLVPGKPEWHTLSFPTDATDTSPKRWLVLELG